MDRWRAIDAIQIKSRSTFHFVMGSVNVVSHSADPFAENRRSLSLYLAAYAWMFAYIMASVESERLPYTSLRDCLIAAVAHIPDVALTARRPRTSWTLACEDGGEALIIN